LHLVGYFYNYWKCVALAATEQEEEETKEEYEETKMRINFIMKYILIVPNNLAYIF
jgi:hypothetical protein